MGGLVGGGGGGAKDMLFPPPSQIIGGPSSYAYGSYFPDARANLSLRVAHFVLSCRGSIIDLHLIKSGLKISTLDKLHSRCLPFVFCYCNLSFHLFSQSVFVPPPVLNNFLSNKLSTWRFSVLSIYYEVAPDLY